METIFLDSGFKFEKKLVEDIKEGSIEVTEFCDILVILIRDDQEAAALDLYRLNKPLLEGAILQKFLMKSVLNKQANVFLEELLEATDFKLSGNELKKLRKHLILNELSPKLNILITDKLIASHGVTANEAKYYRDINAYYKYNINKKRSK